MTQTIQFRSCALLSKADNNLTKNKLEIQDNMRLLLSLLDSLNNLSQLLNRLNNAVERKVKEQNIYRKIKGEMK